MGNVKRVRIHELRPEITPFTKGQTLLASGGRWKATDNRECEMSEEGIWSDFRVRDIYHFDTLMAEFRCEYSVATGQQVGDWEFVPLHRGVGSSTDQHGINMLASHRYIWKPGEGRVFLKDYGWLYLRDQGQPRIINHKGDEVWVPILPNSAKLPVGG